MKETVDSKRCSGCGICEIVCPEIFRMSVGGRKKCALVHTEIVPEEAINFCRDARDCCKQQAIAIVEKGGKPRYSLGRRGLVPSYAS
ncbi:MAG: ferredoxin [Spartobacteria bacterium]|nr:ferredoxin [Spartobacteria bacterium]